MAHSKVKKRAHTETKNSIRDQKVASPPSPPNPLSPFFTSQKTRSKTKNLKKSKTKALILRKRMRSERLRKADVEVSRAMRVVSANPKDARGLSTRDRLFVTNMLKGLPQHEAMALASKAIGVELTERSAAVLAGRALEKQEVESAIVSAMTEAGITDQLVAEKLKDGLDATAFTQTGIEHKDFRTILAYVQTVLKVKKQIGPDVAVGQQVVAYQSFNTEEADG